MENGILLNIKIELVSANNPDSVMFADTFMEHCIENYIIVEG